MLDFTENQLKRTYLKEISNVDYKGSMQWGDIEPLIVMQDLETTDLVL